MAEKNNTLEAIKTPEGLTALLDDLLQTIDAQGKQIADLKKAKSVSPDKVAELELRVEELEQRPEAAQLETKVQLKTHADLMRDELKDIETNTADHIDRRAAYGLNTEDAAKAVESRKKFIRSELGIKPVVKAAKKAAAAALILFACLLGLVSTAPAADNQGYAFSPYSPANLPVWPVATLTNGTAIPYSLNSPATNYVPIRSKSGLALQGIFGGVTNVSGSEVVYLYPSADGTNAINPNAPLATVSGPTNLLGGTNATIFGTNWSELTLRGYTGLFYTVSNACNGPIITGGTITNVQNGVTNYYPAGLLFNRPN